ncbi:MAG TPA: hypothetical protein VFE42_04655 [Chloroflexota bacterium]|nr:hypothetical protein [Chloroflexota bacterium]
MKPIVIGMKALLSDGAMCTVMDVWIDPHNGTERFLVLDANGYFGPDVAVPVSRVRLVDECVHLDLNSAELCVQPLAHDLAMGEGRTLRSCAAVRYRAHWPYRAGLHYPPAV